MNVLHVIPAIASRYGGPSEVVVTVTKALIEAGIDAEIATTDADGFGRLPVECGVLTDWKSVPVRFFRRQFSEAFKFSNALQQWLCESVPRFDLVHIHAVFSHSSVVAYKACMASNVPYLLRPLGSLDSETLSQKPLKKRFFNAVWGREMLSNASALHYSTVREMKEVEKTFGPHHGFIAPTGIASSNSGFRHTLSARSGSKYVPDAPYIVFLGRLDPIKRIELLIEAFATATKADSLSPWRLVLAGDGDPGYAARIRKVAVESGAVDRIVFTGWLPDDEKMDLLSGAELLVLLSKHENFGRAAAEAMTVGIPVFISDGVYLADDVRENNAGWVVSDCIDEISGTLRRVLASSHQRRSAGRAAHDLAARTFDLSKSTEVLMSHYRKLAKNRRE